MIISIVDCYTDEPAGLGVPPYLGVYPRYIAGVAFSHSHQCFYLRIDDLRPEKRGNSTLTMNSTLNANNATRILEGSHIIIVISGMHTPGKYLAAVPGTPSEAIRLLQGYRGKKILTGPAAFLGTGQTGGRIVHRVQNSGYDLVIEGDAWLWLEQYLTSKEISGGYSRLREFAVKGSEIVRQIQLPIIAEIETGRGCPRKIGCSFCLEPLKNKPEWREQNDVKEEMASLAHEGVEHFRLGKQSDFYAFKGGKPAEIEQLLKGAASVSHKTLHIDNVNPALAATEQGEAITRLIVNYCTPGNVAAMGVESFDQSVIEANNINSTPEQVMKAIASINQCGSERGDNGMPKYLPGINIILGLIGETKDTLEINLQYLKRILNEGYMLRRINIRQVEVFPDTEISRQGGLKYLKKNKRHYYKFRRSVREDIDHEMLKRITPVGTILKDVFMELYDGKHTFGRQFGSYPLIVGVKQRLPLREFFDVRVVGHMLRSLVAEPLTSSSSQIDHQAN